MQAGFVKKKNFGTTFDVRWSRGLQLNLWGALTNFDSEPQSPMKKNFETKFDDVVGSRGL